MINRALLGWYRDNARPLPWRSTRRPWPILVSEVMSQQTQISRVVPAWERFMARFPEPGDLAVADVAEALELWAGMGYQRRVLNLRRAAAVIAAEGWPTTADGLRALPGVGPYTAAAVACFAFGEVVPAVDTNLRRVVSRWEGRPLAGDRLTAVAGQRLDRADPVAWNQAVMDLAATLCRPRNPGCRDCPVTTWCADPTVYVAPPRQSPYQGSVRQARAAVLKRLASHGPQSVESLPHTLGLDPGTVARALGALARERTVIETAGSLALSADDRRPATGGP